MKIASEELALCKRFQQLKGQGSATIFGMKQLVFISQTKNAHIYMNWIASYPNAFKACFRMRIEGLNPWNEKMIQGHIRHWKFERSPPQCAICLSFCPTASHWPRLSKYRTSLHKSNSQPIYISFRKLNAIPEYLLHVEASCVCREVTGGH